MNTLTHHKQAILPLLATIVFGCFMFLPQVKAVAPTPDGCYPNFTTAEGCNALNFLTTGAGNTGVGWRSLFLDSTGSFNTGVGGGALALNNGDSNTATGAAALLLNTSGTQNTAVGTDAMVFNDTGGDNTAVGAFALFNNIGGSRNNAFGSNAMGNHQTGDFNNAVGGNALNHDQSGHVNNALGDSALFNNVSGSNNTAIGDIALLNNDSSGLGLGNNNTAVGGMALFNNVDGSENTAVGTGAGPNVIAGFNDTYVGDFVGTLAPDESNTIRIGDLSNGNGAGSLACFIGGIFNNFQPVGGSVVEVTLNLANDELGWDIGPNQGGSAPVQRGVPVPRSSQLPAARLQRQAMLNDKVEKLEATVAEQQKQIEALTEGLQKVSAQFEASKPAPQVVNNP